VTAGHARAHDDRGLDFARQCPPHHFHEESQ
jgi:hypothetical protein